MAIKTSFEDLFKEGPNGEIQITSQAPEPLLGAIQDAESDVNSGSEWVIRAVGKPRRSLDFGTENLTPVQTESATLFISRVEEGEKILAVGVSDRGPLTNDQTKEALVEIGREATLTQEEKVLTNETADALRSIKQTRYFLSENSATLNEYIAELKVLLDSPQENQEEIIEHLDDIELRLHNLLSSVYTFTETAEQSFRSLDILTESKYLIQRFEDDISVAIGFRHCFQHKNSLPVKWMAGYSHTERVYEYQVGVPITHVNNPELYQGKPADASGERHSPTEYYYGDIDTYLIDIESLSLTIEKESESKYYEIKEMLVEQGLKGADILDRFYRLKSKTPDVQDLY